MGNQGQKTKIDDGYGDYVLVPGGEFEPEHWNEEKYKGGGIPGNEDYPVVGISWFEAMAYCRWLSEKTGNKYRLPTGTAFPGKQKSYSRLPLRKGSMRFCRSAEAVSLFQNPITDDL
jgi:hypothetical protein